MFRIRIFWSESSYSGATSLTQKLLFSSIDLHTLIMVEGASPPPSSSWYADPWLRIRTFGEGFWLLNKNFQTVHKVHILNIFKSSFSKRILFSQSHARRIPGKHQCLCFLRKVQLQDCETVRTAVWMKLLPMLPMLPVKIVSMLPMLAFPSESALQDSDWTAECNLEKGELDAFLDSECRFLFSLCFQCTQQCHIRVIACSSSDCP